jgi:hypothetical protein
MNVPDGDRDERTVLAAELRLPELSPIGVKIW